MKADAIFVGENGLAGAFFAVHNPPSAARSRTSGNPPCVMEPFASGAICLALKTRSWLGMGAAIHAVAGKLPPQGFQPVPDGSGDSLESLEKPVFPFASHRGL